jgi:hypothetical protein
MNTTLHSQKIQKKKKLKQTIIQMNKTNENMSEDELRGIISSVLKKKKSSQKLMVRCLTELGWLTVLSYGNHIEALEMIDDYVNGRIENTEKFNDNIYQVHLIITEQE